MALPAETFPPLFPSGCFSGPSDSPFGEESELEAEEPFLSLNSHLYVWSFHREKSDPSFGPSRILVTGEG